MVSLWKTPGLGALIFSVWRADARRKLELASPWMTSEDRLLEVGSGPGSVLFEFRKAGLQVDGIDVTDTSFADSLRAELYDGRRMPFANNSYDTEGGVVAPGDTILEIVPSGDSIVASVQ
ncbi:MAG: hypothetical protein AAFQ12_03060, partial [Pseudomonadota bacterium]